jgi:hypothetical protein
LRRLLGTGILWMWFGYFFLHQYTSGEVNSL